MISGQCQVKGMVGDFVDAVIRDVVNEDSLFFGGFDDDIVHAGAATNYRPASSQFADQRGIEGYFMIEDSDDAEDVGEALVKFVG